ncbi:MAG: aminotransferase class V-fold PLP-dependent enzyme [Clostridia bacterium]|nr:aminotransferase class V-fold PLP-dependent enzyme [Clostridia bacterium]
MKTPVCDFVREYASKNPVRLHMPGHKGEGDGADAFDITEIDGADTLFVNSGILGESQKNASALFGTAKTLYSAEGSSLAIRAMLWLVSAKAKRDGTCPLVLAGRNAHKVFTGTAALLGIDVKWIFPDGGGYLECPVTASKLGEELENCPKKPCAVYITSPDYLGNIADIEALSAVCGEYGVPLLVDNAHGAYLRFLKDDIHPITLGADMCCDSAHKTLPVLTGGAYLHISKTAEEFFAENAENAMSLFASTSPSYLILQSLDSVNPLLESGFSSLLEETVRRTGNLKKYLCSLGFELAGDEPTKVTVKPKSFGYTG